MLFSAATLRFLRGLSRNNDRTWFEAHRAEYEAAVPRRSMFRTYPDVRFSADKAPYKTHAANP